MRRFYFHLFAEIELKMTRFELCTADDFIHSANVSHYSFLWLLLILVDNVLAVIHLLLNHVLFCWCRSRAFISMKEFCEQQQNRHVHMLASHAMATHIRYISHFSFSFGYLNREIFSSQIYSLLPIKLFL